MCVFGYRLSSFTTIWMCACEHQTSWLWNVKQQHTTTCIRSALLEFLQFIFSVICGFKFSHSLRAIYVVSKVMFRRRNCQWRKRITKFIIAGQKISLVISRKNFIFVQFLLNAWINVNRFCSVIKVKVGKFVGKK